MEMGCCASLKSTLMLIGEIHQPVWKPRLQEWGMAVEDVVTQLPEENIEHHKQSLLLGDMFDIVG